MPVDSQEIREITDSDGNKQHAVFSHHTPVQNDPSTVRYLVDNERYIKQVSKQMAGLVQVPNPATGDMEWVSTGKPLMNPKGRNWMLQLLSAALGTYQTLSNYSENAIDDKIKAEMESTSDHLATHLIEYDLAVEDCESVMVPIRKAIYAGYRRAVNDKGAGHAYGSVGENTSPQRRSDKWLGIVPKVF